MHLVKSFSFFFYVAFATALWNKDEYNISSLSEKGSYVRPEGLKREARSADVAVGLGGEAASPSH